MIDLLLSSPVIPTPIEARLFVGMCCAYLVYDYKRDITSAIERKIRKRTNRQIFDGHNQVSDMISAVLLTNRFSSLGFSDQMKIIRFINNQYK